MKQGIHPEYKKTVIKCVCGNECDVDANNLRSLHTISCGCIKREKSVGAVNITKILKENNINFKPEIFGQMRWKIV